jgi:hypothetical protein
MAKENKRLKDQIALVEEELRESQARLAAAIAATARRQKLAVAGPAQVEQPTAMTATAAIQKSPRAKPPGPPKPGKASKAKDKPKPEELPSPVTPDTPPIDSCAVGPKLPSPREVASRLQEDAKARSEPEPEREPTEKPKAKPVLMPPMPKPKAPIGEQKSSNQPVVQGPADPPAMDTAKKKPFAFPKPAIIAPDKQL